MLWIKAAHIIFIVTWFSGLFYLPRLFVYHAMSEDAVSIQRFKIMERKLYYGIIIPSAALATLFGLWLLLEHAAIYMQLPWMWGKLALVLALWAYQGLCGYYRRQFNKNANTHSHIFYRWFNEIPVVILVGIVILVIVKP